MTPAPRIGIGFDTHQLVTGRPLVIGGVIIDFALGLAGHSDADVLVHAIADAVLGAAALGDIGAHFPDSDPNYADADSLVLLKQCRELLRERELDVYNVDSTVIAEAPLMGSYRAAMVANIGAALNLPTDCVNVKFTRGEGMGYLGRGEGIAALATASIG